MESRGIVIQLFKNRVDEETNRLLQEEFMKAKLSALEEGLLMKKLQILREIIGRKRIFESSKRKHLVRNMEAEIYF